MDFFDIDNVKAEKANAMKRYDRLQKIANIFRLFEVSLVFIFFLWFSTRVPIAFQASGKYFKFLGDVLVSPRFVFLVGNAIILTLFVKSGQFSGQSSSAAANGSSGSSLYDEFLTKNESRQKIRPESPSPAPEEEAVVFQDKQTICEEASAADLHRDAVTREAETMISETKTHQIIQRSKSEKLALDPRPERELRRSETEKCCHVERSGEEPARTSYAEDDMSSEEFRRTIEAFIAKQVRFHRQESMAIVLRS